MIKQEYGGIGMMKRLLSMLLAALLLLTAVPAPAEEVWVPGEAPAIRQTLAEEEVVAERNAILAKGELLYSGKVNRGYNAGPNIAWLKEAAPEDVLALVWACDDDPRRLGRAGAEHQRQADGDHGGLRPPGEGTAQCVHHR